jgi:hypothetical protein
MDMKFATIFREDMEYISRCVLDCPDIETGGDFFGFWNNLGLPVIQYVTGPGAQSGHHVDFFRQDVEFLRKAGNAVYQTFGMQHIGSWHSHHKLGLAVPSGHDCRTMANAIQNNGLSQFFMILCNIRDGGTTINGFLFDSQHQRRYTETQWRILERDNPFSKEINKSLASQSAFTYSPKTSKARLVNLKTVNPAGETVFVLQFKPEAWLGGARGKDELKYVHDWMLARFPDAKMFINEAKDLSIVASDLKITFLNDFPNSHPVILRGEIEVVRDESPFVYNDGEDIVSYLRPYMEKDTMSIEDAPDTTVVKEVANEGFAATTIISDRKIDDIIPAGRIREEELIVLSYYQPGASGKYRKEMRFNPDSGEIEFVFDKISNIMWYNPETGVLTADHRIRKETVPDPIHEGPLKMKNEIFPFDHDCI